jgi:hypothetical protein
LFTGLSRKRDRKKQKGINKARPLTHSIQNIKKNETPSSGAATTDKTEASALFRFDIFFSPPIPKAQILGSATKNEVEYLSSWCRT